MNKSKLFQKAEQAGFEASEIYTLERTETSVEVCEGAIESHEINSNRSICFRGIVNGKMGYAYTEKFSDDAIDVLVETAKECAQLVEKEDKEFIFNGSSQYVLVENYDETIATLDSQKHISMTLDLEKTVCELAPELDKVANSTIALYTTYTNLSNSYGINLEDRRTQVLAYTEPVAKDGENVVDGYELVRLTTLSKLNLEDLSQAAIRNALRKVGATPIPSGKYPAIFESNVMATLLQVMKSAFFADVMQEGKSLLKNKVGKSIASACVNIIDDPHMLGGLASCSFDDEGVATYQKFLVENGNFKGFLHNLKTAYKDGVQTTGNASKASITAPVRVASSNLYLQPGNTPLEHLLLEIKEGVYITSLQGVHAGANAITGDFSLSAEGLRIEDGQLTTGIKGITIAGNFFELLKQIEAIADDFKMNSVVGSASVRIKEVSVAGN